MSTYIYRKEAGKGSLVLSLSNSGGNVIWENKYPAYIEDAGTGDLIEEQTLIESGVMKSLDDTAGLQSHLSALGIITSADSIELKN